MKKDTVYIDADDEISEVADKVISSKAKVVALVLPKRCNMLHSSVNMKILNKAAKNAGKQIVLITSEKALLPIAGASGLYVAKTLKSKPEVPPVESDDDSAAAVAASAAATTVAASLDEEPSIDANKPIGELAGDEPIEIDEAKDDKKEEASKEKTKKDKKLVVPNFDSFRVKLFIGLGSLIIVLVFLFVAAFVLPKATITIEAETQEIPLNIEITASPDGEDNIDEKTFNLITKSEEKSESKKAETTGEKNNGKKASGSVIFYNCSVEDKLGDVSRTVPAGTGISSGSNTYITQTAVTVLPSGFTSGGTSCKFDKPTGDVTVVAQDAGESYNADPGNYKVSGFSTLIAEDTDGMTGGTDDTVKIVSETDCSALKDSLVADSNSEDYKNQLLDEFENEGLSASLDTFKAETISNNCVPAVGQEAKEVTAQATFKYTLSGVSSEALSNLLTKEAQDQAGDDQDIIDNGLSAAILTVEGTSGQVTSFLVKATATTGVKQDADKIKDLVAGKNARETSEIIKSINGVKDVQIDYSPFWVNKTPTNKDKINIIFNNSDGQ